MTLTELEIEVDQLASDQASNYYKETIAKIVPLFQATSVVQSYETEIYS